MFRVLLDRHRGTPGLINPLSNMVGFRAYGISNKYAGNSTFLNAVLPGVYTVSGLRRHKFIDGTKTCRSAWVLCLCVYIRCNRKISLSAGEYKELKESSRKIISMNRHRKEKERAKKAEEETVITINYTNPVDH